MVQKGTGRRLGKHACAPFPPLLSSHDARGAFDKSQASHGRAIRVQRACAASWPRSASQDSHPFGSTRRGRSRNIPCSSAMRQPRLCQARGFDLDIWCELPPLWLSRLRVRNIGAPLAVTRSPAQVRRGCAPHILSSLLVLHGCSVDQGGAPRYRRQWRCFMQPRWDYQRVRDPWLVRFDDKPPSRRARC